MSEWRVRAYCRDLDPGIFYPYDPETDDPLETEETSREAKVACSLCLVRRECLEEAISRKEKRGIWGGLTTQERTNLIRKRNR